MNHVGTDSLGKSFDDQRGTVLFGRRRRFRMVMRFTKGPRSEEDILTGAKAKVAKMMMMLPSVP